jgi:pimeloyl-ACP methyl ester carboxylesterase
MGLGGCWIPPDPPVNDPEWLIAMESPTTITGDDLSEAHDNIVRDILQDAANGDISDIDYNKWLELLRRIAPHVLECRRITYYSRDAYGEKIELTGMLYLPKPHIFKIGPRSVKLLLYPHGTELKKSRVPSNNDGDEWIFGAVAALVGGFAVAMPDLPGMGGAAADRYHPYCHADSLAYSIVDMGRAVTEAFDRDLRFDYEWDGRLYVMGYSEGGYAAMAAVKELQLNAGEYPDLAVTASACMAGPYDLTGAMRTLMIDPTLKFPRPFFLPYVVYGYHAVYPDGPFDPSDALNDALLPDITTWMDGSQTGDYVNPLIAEALGVEPTDVNPRDMLDAQWVATQLDDDVYETSDVGVILAANNLWSDWAPSTPMLMRQSPDDDCVPFDNSLKAYSEFIRAGAMDYITFRPIGKKGDGIGHVKGAIIGIPSAIMWLANDPELSGQTQ